MAENGISTLPTKEDRQQAKLELAQAKRISQGDPHPYYDITLLPTQYNNNDVQYNDHPSGLVVGRPWVSSPVSTSSILQLDGQTYSSTGNWLDQTTNHHDAVLHSGVSYSTEHGGVFVFDGTTSYMSLPPDMWNWITLPTTIHIWFKTSSPGTLLGQQASYNVNDTGPGFVPAIYIDTDRLLRASIFWSTLGTNGQLIGSTVVTDNQWHLVTVTYTQETGVQTLYLDGVSEGSNMHDQVSYFSNYYYFIGAGANQWTKHPTTAYYNGSIGNVLIRAEYWDQTLVTSYYNNTKLRFEPFPTPIFYLNALDYLDGTPTWVDRSSDHRTINLSNVTYDGSNPSYPLVVFGTNKTGIDSAASTQIGNLTTFTVSVWLKINTLPSSLGDREILADNEQSWGFRLDYSVSGLKLNFVKYGVSDQYVTIPFSLTTGRLYNIVGAMDSTETRYYIDGVKIGTYTNNASKQTPTGGSTITINGKNSFDFSLFSAQIYDSPLSDAQVALLHTLI